MTCCEFVNYGLAKKTERLRKGRAGIKKKPRRKRGLVKPF
jgi:hypothetical protein